MRYVLPLLCLVLVSCTQHERLNVDAEPLKIDPTKPPDGMHLVQILLENQSLPVKGTHCEDSGRSPDKRRLLHQLAMALGDGLNNPRIRNELLGDCEPDQYELPSGKTVDAWQCRLGVVQKDEKGEFGASANIYFGITKDTWEIIPDPRALRCT